ncbi:zinc finger protein 831 isoform X1 [Camelus ferus]|uniref:Zinc finger protein 831 isoform X1 n=2 Tax=Camelus TaxID=9836 RepID=A0A8B8RHJ0_CAMFR|nr:zinc finger protein 831 isoform X1 [Camelus ferus]
MEVPDLTCATSPARDQPAPASGPLGAPGGQASPHLTLGPVILPPEQSLAPTVFLKALPIPLYHTVPPGGLQPRAPLLTGSLEGGGMPFILSPMLQPEGPGPTQVGKPAAPTLTVNIVGPLPVLSPGLGPTLGSPGKVRNAGKYLCPHCGRDCLKPSVLEKHIRSHTGERPFPCATCGIAFKTQSNLYKHRRTQTHLNNSRLSSESEGGGSSLPEEGDKAGEPAGAAGRRSQRPRSLGSQAAGLCPAPTAHGSPVAKSLDVKSETVPGPGSAFDVREAALDAAPGPPPAGAQPRRKLPEQRSPTAGRPSAAEKPAEARAAEGRLRKCESTDSGYLSRSDSAEQPPAAGSPLHSLSEHSAESEGEGGPGPGRGGRPAGLELEKRRLEERIARLISHNQAVVDDPQLDNVRPRKTVLSKQGSIDLPMPYTYKDSFHFDLRPPEPGRRRPAALGAARSTFTPPDKARPLFFHSVPTQLSTGTECVPVTRSNSLPFVEGTRTWPEPPDPQDAWLRRQKPLSARPAPARPADVPSGHPRALVRQAAVEDLPGPPTGEMPTPPEDPDGKSAAGEGAASKGQGAARKRSPRKLKMFSQEKWQVYGNETFKRIYQKMKGSHQGGKQAREVTGAGGAELDRPLQEEAAGSKGAAPSQDARRTPVPGDTSLGAKPAPSASPPALEGFLVTQPPKQRKTVARGGGSDQPGVNALSCREPPCLGNKSPLLPPNRGLELGFQLPPELGPPEGGDLEASRPGLPDPKLEGSTHGSSGSKETCQRAHVVLRWPGDSSWEPQPTEEELPSERKKLKVEELSCQEPLRAGGETPGGPVQATSPPAQNQDSDPREKPGELPGSGDCTVRVRAGRLGEPGKASSASPEVASGALRHVGPQNKDSLLCPTAPRGPSLAATQPRTPSILTAPVDTSFLPQYLLRLPQGETHPPPPVTQKPDQGPDPLCRSGYLEERASFVRSGLGALLPPCPALSQVPGGADSFWEDPSWSGPRDRRKRVLGEEKGGLDTGLPAAGAPRRAASFLPTPVCDSRGSETHDTQALCGSSTAARACPSGGVLSPWEPNRELRGPPESVSAEESPSPERPAGLSPCCSRQPSSFLSALSAPGWPELAVGTQAETLGLSGAQGPFPSLRAEPRLTWCCLSRSLPLPMEQKEKDASVYLALHFPGDSPPEEGPDARPVSKAVSGGWPRTRPGGGGQTQMLKLSDPAVPAVTSQDRVSEPGWKKALPRRRAKTLRGSSRQRTLSIVSKRYTGSFSQSRAQLRARKPHWVLRKDCRPPPVEGPAPRRTRGQASAGMAGLSLSGESSSVASEASLCGGHGEKEEEEDRHTSGSFSPNPSSGTVGETDRPTLKEIAPSAGEHGNSCPQNTAIGSGSSLPSDSSVAVAGDSLLSCSKGLDMGLLETHLSPFQEQVSTDSTLCIFSDAQEPSSFEAKRTSVCHDVATSAVAVCASLGASVGHTASGSHSAGPRDHSRAAGETLPQSSPDRKTMTEGVTPSLLPGTPSSGQRIPGSVPLGSIGKTHLETPASGPGSAGPPQEEGTCRTCFPSGGQQGCGEALAPCPPLGRDSGKCQVSGFVALKDDVVPSNPEQPTETPGVPLKTLRKRSLEGMRKQTRVEFSDTSSDDEDRLVIEI